MFHVYILLSLRDAKFYTGFTSNLKLRIEQHNNGEVASTKNRRPLALIYYECYLQEADARRNEKYYKTTKGRTDLRKKLKDILKKYNGTIAQR